MESAVPAVPFLVELRARGAPWVKCKTFWFRTTLSVHVSQMWNVTPELWKTCVFRGQSEMKTTREESHALLSVAVLLFKSFYIFLKVGTQSRGKKADQVHAHVSKYLKKYIKLIRRKYLYIWIRIYSWNANLTESYPQGVQKKSRFIDKVWVHLIITVVHNNFSWTILSRGGGGGGEAQWG